MQLPWLGVRHQGELLEESSGLPAGTGCLPILACITILYAFNGCCLYLLADGSRLANRPYLCMRCHVWTHVVHASTIVHASIIVTCICTNALIELLITWLISECHAQESLHSKEFRQADIKQHMHNTQQQCMQDVCTACSTPLHQSYAFLRDHDDFHLYWMLICITERYTHHCKHRLKEWVVSTVLGSRFWKST